MPLRRLYWRLVWSVGAACMRGWVDGAAIQSRADTRVNAILDDVRGVTSTVKEEAERVDRLMQLAGDLVGSWRTRGSTTPS